MTNPDKEKAKFKRQTFLRANKKQRKLLALGLLPVFFLCLFISAYYNKFYAELFSAMQDESLPQRIDDFVLWHRIGTISLWVMFIGVILWITRIANNMLGAYDRIVRECDEILQGNRKGPITVRPNDVLFKELLERINVFIEVYQNQSKGK